MMLQKRFAANVISEQSALELPRRQMLTLVVIRNVLNGLHVNVNVSNNHIGLQVCAAVQAINTIIAPTVLTCRLGA
jgi:hypothetical protein